MKHKYRNYYFPVLICIVFCLCIFLVRHVFSVRTQTNASLPVTEVRQSFSFLNTIDFKWYAYSLNLLWAALILAPIGIINVCPYIIFSYIIDTILIRREVKALIKKYSIDQIKCG